MHIKILFRQINNYRMIYSISRIDQSDNLNNKNFNFGIINHVNEIFRYKETNISNWIIEGKVRNLCHTYKNLSEEEKEYFLWTLAHKYAVDHDKYLDYLNKMKKFKIKVKNNDDDDDGGGGGGVDKNEGVELLLQMENLKKILTPKYEWLFVMIGRLEHGIKFLVDLRTKVLSIDNRRKDAAFKQLNSTLHNLLLLWFSIGFLHLERITWQSSCEMLQKISEYEAIHPIRNWVDLKRRVGLYRRCFIFTHPSMPNEPLIVLHTALSDSIPDTVKGIDLAEKRIISKSKLPADLENISEIRSAVFYSITATQKGLQGIELGNYLIKQVVKELKYEFQMLDEFSSLSPIPKFRLWLLDTIKNDVKNIFTKEEMTILEDYLKTNNLIESLKKLWNNSLWLNDNCLTDILKIPLLRSCAWYLYKEKRRNYALNSVANFHLRNGAIMWRINWMADCSPRGADNSCGLMVNYRYYINECDTNSCNYIEKYIIKTSDSVKELVNQMENK